MKAFKAISIIMVSGVLILTTFSCKKKDNQKRDFYLEQSRDEDLADIFQLLKQDTSNQSILEWNIKMNGEAYQTIVRDGVRYEETSPLFYWYSKDGKLFKLFYSNDWDKGSYEEVADYWFSDTKDTLFIKYDYTNVVSTFIRQ